jgi:hypothetical protein
MARKEILTCDRCKLTALSVHPVDLGKDLTKTYDSRNDKSVKVELCKACWASVYRFTRSIRDTFGREIDPCGQVRCLGPQCVVRINHEYPDGMPRKLCAKCGG